MRDKLAAIAITVAIPVLLILGALRLVANPWFLAFEYGRAGFPPDPFGFTAAERLEYAAYTLGYIFDPAAYAETFATTTLEGSRPLYIAREIQHLDDAGALAAGAFGFILPLMIVIGGAGAFLLRQGRVATMGAALVGGGAFTLAIVVGVPVLAVLSWDLFFNTFHEVFFPPGTWRFYTSDTLIRLFPEQFWFDAVIAAGLIAGAGAVGFVIAGRLLMRRRKQEGTDDD